MVLIYQLYDHVRDICSNLDDISHEDDYKYLPSTTKVMKESPETDTIELEVTATNAPLTVGLIDHRDQRKYY